MQGETRRKERGKDEKRKDEKDEVRKKKDGGGRKEYCRESERDEGWRKKKECCLYSISTW